MILVRDKDNLVFPSNYRLDEDGIWKIKMLKSGEKRTYVGKPLNILGVYFTKDKGYGILIEWTAPDNSIHKYYINNSDFFGGRWAKHILSAGYFIGINRINDLRNFLCDTLCENAITYNTV
jgi:hypothetical protein